MVNSLKIVDGRVYLEKSLLSKLFDLLKVFGLNLPTPWLRVCRLNGFNEVNQKELNKLFDYLLFCLEQVCADKEMESLIKALDGNYVLPGPGGDPIRNPGVLPSGKNIHALDPQSIPTTAAVAAAKSVVDKLIERQKEEQGTWPETIACVLWGTDNIKNLWRITCTNFMVCWCKTKTRFCWQNQQIRINSFRRIRQAKNRCSS